MKKIKKFFEKYCGKWGLKDFLLLDISYPAIILCAVIFPTNILSVFASLFGIFISVISSHAKVLSRFLWFIYCIIYGTLVISNLYYGEIVSLGIVFVLNIFCLISWIKNQKNNVIKVNNLSTLELLLSLLFISIFAIGLFFVLKVINTSNLAISTITTSISVLGWYYYTRRSAYAYVVFLLADFCICILWSIPILQGKIDNIPIIISSLIYIFLDLIGLFNWTKIQKTQQKSLKKEQIKTL